MLFDVLGIYLRYNQGNTLVHAEKRRIINNYRTRLYRAGRKLLGNRAPGRRKHQFNALERIVRQFLDRKRIAHEFDFLAS